MGGAPPQLVVLLWHHAIYYKRHWFITLWTVFKPLLLFCILYFFVMEVKRLSVMKPVQLVECSYPGHSGLSDGPLHAAVSHDFLGRGKLTHRSVPTGKGQDIFANMQQQSCLKFPMMRNDDYDNYDPILQKALLDVRNKTQKDLTDKKAMAGLFYKWPVVFGMGFRVCNTTDNDDAALAALGKVPGGLNPQDESAPTQRAAMDQRKKLALKWMNQFRTVKTLICTILKDKIMYYPNNNKWVSKIMQRVEEIINVFQTFTQRMKGEPVWCDPRNKPAMGIPLWKDCLYTPPPDPVFFVLPWDYYNYGEQLKSKPRTRAFPSLEALQSHTRDLSKSYLTPSVPWTWGIVSFADFPNTLNDSSKPLKYAIVYDTVPGSNANNQNSEETWWLQELIERAIVEVVTEETTGNTVDIGTYYKPTPNKCWSRPRPEGYLYFMVILSFGSCFAFLSPPATFLSQVLLEKQLKLREYLYITGVGSLTLKVSWILFYSLFLIPLSVLFMFLLVTFMSDDYMTFSDPFFLYILLILFNFCMLCFCYMLSSLISDPRSSTQLLYFLHIFVLVLCITTFGTNMAPEIVFLARVTSLHPVVPLILGFDQVLNWEKQWQGLSWSNFMYSPVVTSNYGGVGEALAWLVGDIFLYIFLAWYFEKIYPGEFGQKQPFYFLLMPSYWCRREKETLPHLEKFTADVELMNDKQDGIVIQEMTKVYPNGVIGLNQLTLTYYKNQITAFLGHNGAGKSTTIHCLVGLITPTSGGATVHGMHIQTEMDQMRQIVGFVPQHDILYPDFTMDEHLQFFGWLKGLSKSEIQRTTDPLLDDMQLEGMESQVTTRLSGGQKRKLSILTAYLGAPKVIIFDEPTSGIDCYSRRVIWETILNHKKDSTIILSTHFMDEADLLGDRIAIIHEGNLKCAGSPMYLKAKYGRGYRLTVTRNVHIKHSKHAIQKFITGLIPDAKLTEDTGQEMDFEISKELAKSDQIISVLEKIESHYNDAEYGIVSYGLHEPTIEEVFFASIRTDDREEDDEEGMKFATDVKYHKSDTSWFQKMKFQARALFQKRLLFSINSAAVMVLQTVVPFTFVLMLAIAGQNLERNVQVVTMRDPSRTNIIFVQDDPRISGSFIPNAFKFGALCPGDRCQETTQMPDSIRLNQIDNKTIRIANGRKCEDCVRQCQQGPEAAQQPMGILPNGEKLFKLDRSVNVTNWMISINQSTEIVVAGFSFRKLNKVVDEFIEWSRVNGNKEFRAITAKRTFKKYVTITYQKRLKQAVMNMWHTSLLRMMTNAPYRIELKFEGHELIYPGSTYELTDYDKKAMDFLRGFWVIFALNFATFGVLISIHYETNTGLKRMQMMSGANPFLYWIVNVFYDLCLQIVTLLFVVALIAVLPNAYQVNAVEILVIGLTTCLQSIGFFYILAMMFSKTKAVINMAIVISLVCALLAFLFVILEIFLYRCEEMKHCGFQREEDEQCLFSWAPKVTFVLSFIPAYLISDLIHNIGIIQIFLSIAEEELELVCKEAGCFCDMADFYSFRLFGSRLMRAMVWSIIYLAAVFFLEWFDIPDIESVMPSTSKLYKCLIRIPCFGTIVRCMWKKQVDWKDEDIKKAVDEDVLKEANRIDSGGARHDSLVVSHLRKCYKGMLVPAVVDVSFGVSKSDVFGLLGVNGAGKTSVFNMLTGFQRPSAGTATIMDYNLFGSKHSRFQDTSYCPQENTLFQQLTVEQHFKLFAAMRGIPNHVVKRISVRLINECGLADHFGKKASQLSGGTCRKLNFALSLLDYRPVIFLDEPTTGMDPGARRHTWNAIKRAVKKKGCSVVLTSHSMDECEHLCHKIVIMVAGSFLCFGSIQYLKHKYGDKFQFKIKLHGQKTKETATKVKVFIKNRLPTSKLDDEHASVLSFHVPCSHNLRLSQVYRVMSECRNSFPIEDISVSQTTLEQIFINMARMQDDIQKQTIAHEDMNKLIETATKKQAHLVHQEAYLKSQTARRQLV